MKINNNLKKNIYLSIMAQVISLATSFIVNLVLPKFIDELQYAYWQKFILYFNYVGLIHFGLLDGMLLRYSSLDYDDLNKNNIRTQILFLLLFNVAILWPISIFLIRLNLINKEITILLCIGSIFQNLYTFSIYIFQCTNNIKKYTLSLIVNRTTYGLIALILIVLGYNKYLLFCVADIIGIFVGFLIGPIYYSKLYFGKLSNLLSTFKEIKENVKCGLYVYFSNIASTLTINSAKIIIENKWDSIIFGKAAFSFSISNLYMNFINAISIVMFPMLRRIDHTKLKNSYSSLNRNLSKITYLSLLLYYPGVQIIKTYLPKYKVSLEYLIYLLPLIVPTSKLNLIVNNYLKVYRKEKSLLIIETATTLIGIILYYFSSSVMNSIKFVLVSVVIVLFIRYLVSSIYIKRLINESSLKYVICDLIIICIFIISTKLNNRILGVCFYLTVCTILIVIIESRKDK